MNQKALFMGLTPPLQGGSERHIYEISSRIPNSSVATQKNSICKNKIILPTIPKDGVLRNISFMLSSIIFSLFLLLTPKKRYNLIHIHENLLYFIAPLLRLRYKVVVTVHGIKGFKFYDNKFLWFFFKSALDSANTIISVSLADQELLNKDFKHVVYIPNGVDLALYETLKSSKPQDKITFVGRIHNQKGTEYLLKAFLELNKKFPKFKLNIIGKKEGLLYETLSKKYKNKNIIWKGLISDRKVLFSELASSKVLVFPSIWEALPWPALLEGLGSARPVIASDLYGMRKILEDKKDILLFPPKNSKELEKCIEFVLKNKKISEEIGRKGKLTAKKYSWDRLAKEVHNLYNSLISSQ